MRRSECVLVSCVCVPCTVYVQSLGRHAVNTVTTLISANVYACRRCAAPRMTRKHQKFATETLTCPIYPFEMCACVCWTAHSFTGVHHSHRRTVNDGRRSKNRGKNIAEPYYMSFGLFALFSVYCLFRMLLCRAAHWHQWVFAILPDTSCPLIHLNAKHNSAGANVCVCCVVYTWSLTNLLNLSGRKSILHTIPFE